jgi:alkyl hydroperoxide reductase subunit AhpC
MAVLITFRGCWMINLNGTLRRITAYDLPVGRSVDEALGLVQAFQFTVSLSEYPFVVDVAHAMRCGKAKHGEVCPANWKEGGKTIQGGPTAKLEYFAAVDSVQEYGEVNGT